MEKSLASWINEIQLIHPIAIDLGLERIREVFKRLGLTQPICPVIIVGGTNGKGSCVAALEKIYTEQGYKTGVFTSPVLFRHNELVRIEGQEGCDQLFCDAYAKIEKYRQEISLTAYEHYALAVFDILSQHHLDVWIIEVGLGGRLDMVNILDADVAIITSIDLDHMDMLGNTRELIGKEKAGIFRAKKPAVCGDIDPPLSMLKYAEECGSPIYIQGKDFFYTQQDNTWAGNSTSYSALPTAKLAMTNISTALMAIELLQLQLPVSTSAIKQAIETVTLPGRIEIIPGAITHIFDVSHNPAAVRHLTKCLTRISSAVFSMLSDKDIPTSIHQIKHLIDTWYVAPLSVKRAASKEQLQAAFQQENITAVKFYASIEESYVAARQAACAGDTILVFGSFHTVGAVRELVIPPLPSPLLHQKRGGEGDY